MRYRANLWGNVNADPVTYDRWQHAINYGRLSPVHKPRCRTSKENKMREIKFRAWDKIHNEMIDPDFVEIKGNGIIKIYNENHEEWIEDENFVFPMQYTGLKDKNGKPIHEGDIVKWSGDQISEVFWDETDVGFSLRLNNAYWDLSDDGAVCDMEVIGNIYENPELLKESK